MIDYGIVRRIVDALRKLPGMTQKQAERVAFALLQDPAARAAVDGLVAALADARACKKCGWFTAGDEPCGNCGTIRQRICVVESFSDLLGIDRTGEFDGSYHLLGGLIAPLEGMLPEDLNGEALRERVLAGGVEEVIIALPATIEGEATIHYLAELLADTGVRLTRIARGVPAGARVEYLDRNTIGHALKERTPLT